MNHLRPCCLECPYCHLQIRLMSYEIHKTQCADIGTEVSGRPKVASKRK